MGFNSGFKGLCKNRRRSNVLFSLQVREGCFSLLYQTVTVASVQILVAEMLRISFLRGRTLRHWVICSRSSDTATLSTKDGDRLSSEAVLFARRTEQSTDTNVVLIFGTGLVKDRLHWNISFYN